MDNKYILDQYEYTAMLLKVICGIYGDEAVFIGNPELQVLHSKCFTPALLSLIILLSCCLNCSA